MVRKEILTILTQDGYPTNEKPKEKTEKMHPKMKKYWIAFFAILALAAIIGYFALAAQTPVKTATDASAGGDAKATPVPGVKEAVVAVAAGIAAVNPAAASDTDWQKQLEIDKKDPILARRIHDYITPRGEVLIPINSIPKEFKLFHQELNVYIINLKIDDEGGMTGVIENRGINTVKISQPDFLLVRSDYSWEGSSIGQIGDAGNEQTYIKPKEKVGFTVNKPSFSLQAIKNHLDLPSIVFISPLVVT